MKSKLQSSVSVDVNTLFNSLHVVADWYFLFSMMGTLRIAEDGMLLTAVCYVKYSRLRPRLVRAKLHSL